jgi:UDP-N-acetylglucosamine acyltransferase
VSVFPAGVDPKAEIHPGARVGEGTSVGPYAIVGPGAVIGENNRIGAHVIVDGEVEIGSGNTFYPFTVIGLAPQDMKYDGEPTRVEIGDGNTFREYCQVHRGTAGGGGLTRIGSRCFFMVSSHIAHDCSIGDDVLFANAATLAGHVEIGAGATIGAYSGVHQFCRVGRQAFIGGYSVITRDALPYCLTVGNRASCYGLNKVGLQRRGFSRELIRAMDRAVRGMFRAGRSRADALLETEALYPDVREVIELVEFVRSARRGVIPLRLGGGEREE